MVRVDDRDVAQRVFRALELERAVYYLQETLPHSGRDVRALVVGERVVAAIERSGDGWRTNLARGGRARPVRLDAEQERLRAQRKAATLDALRTEIDRSLASLADQRGVRRRLEEARATVIARLEATVLGLESLVARLVEVLAMVEAAPPLEGASKIDVLAEELEGLRGGLAETEELSRSVLSQVRDSSSVEPAVRARPRQRGRGGKDAETP
jgi:hypothetical protein